MTRPGIVMMVVLLAVVSVSTAAQTTVDAAQEALRDDVHGAAGLRCDACHQTDGPSYAVTRTAIAPLCARCHSDPAVMRTYDPQLRVDQYAQYLTSTHGRQMAQGETRVATCTDCHGAHGVRKVSDARSPVAPMNVSETCGRCHADATRMAPFGLQPTPLTDWSASVHAAALLTRGDLSAPTCSTCHGSHGAVPPGVTEVANVCAQCHAREADLFRQSPKKAIFDEMGQPECLTCHGNHLIEHPVDRWVGLQESAVCAMCHDATMKGSDTILAIRNRLDQLSASIDRGEAILSRAELAGMLVDDGRVALRSARDHQIHTRVLVHGFAVDPFEEMADQGTRAAVESQAVGEQALRELQTRRRGLLAATIVIMGFLMTLGIKIRRLRRA